MFQKILLFICFVAITEAVFIQPSYTKESFSKEGSKAWQLVKMYHFPSSDDWKYDHHPHAYPKYEFEYAVSDKKTGDHKHHHEYRDGDKVHGEYSLIEADGSLRKVEYNANDHDGFNAVVSKSIQKHGDHAYSVSDQTSHFYPSVHEVKIHHFFPTKDHQESLKHDMNTKPVTEEDKESAAPESKMDILEGDKMIILNKEAQPSKMVAPVLKPDIVVATPIMPTIPTQKKEEEIITDAPTMMEQSKVVLVSDKVQVVEDQMPQQEEKTFDSEVASSYFSPRMYYIRY